jgi:hypothetical protein
MASANLVLAIVTFLGFFYSTTLAVSLIFGLEAALLKF